SDILKKFNPNIKGMSFGTANLVYGGRYNGREDFAAVVQPFFRNSILPLDADGKPDTTYFSVDCFHFSERGQADMAAALWNNMMEPVDDKMTYNNFRNNRSNIKCPTEVRIRKTFDLTTDCSGKVEAWVAGVVAVVGLLVGSAVVGLFFYCKNKKSKKKRSGVEMKGTTF
uniref:Uncharacterized protein n=1 Tax=Oryzias melastigma TaxID=30732 RepID=A0A3B3C311_ORYME